MYDLSNLNDYEFEILAKDIMEAKLGVQLHRFSKGRDLGIDLCDSSNDIKTLIQVKHYIKSTRSDLMNSLKKEIPKVEKVNPTNYYVFCSAELTRENKREIISLFPKYCKDISYVIDKIDVIDFLSKNANEEILKRNYKLWFYSADLMSKISNQHCVIDCEELLSNINEDIKLFVNTQAYHECLKTLNDKNVLIVTGSPGVGKSTISKMLILNYLSKDYVIRFVSNNDIKDLKNSISSNPEKKEVILLDDFLGQHYLNIKDTLPNEIKSLISYVEKSPSKKLILNSRITIMNEARTTFLGFNKMLEQHITNQYIIDLDKMSHLEKAKILYNHLYFSSISAEHFDSVKQNNNYEGIIKHSNYNPRIIEYVTNNNNLSEVLPKNYLKFILDNLNNPNKVWDDEFRNRLTDVDRIFMHTLYSLTDTSISVVLLKEAFNYRIFQSNVESTENHFDDVYKRLSNSLIKTRVNSNKDSSSLEVSVVNPSVNDYLRERIKSNTNEQKNIIKYACFIQQNDKIMRINPSESRNYFHHDESKLKSIDKSISYHYLTHIVKFDIRDLNYKSLVENAFLIVCSNSSSSHEDLIIDIIKTDIISCYALDKVLIDNLDTALTYFDYDAVNKVYEWYSIKYNPSKEILCIFKSKLKDAIEEMVSEKINEDLPQITSDCIGDMSLKRHDDEDIEQTYINFFYSDIQDAIEDLIKKEVQNLIDESPIAISKDDINFEYIFYGNDIDGSIKSFVKDMYDDGDMSEHDDEGKIAEKEEWDKIRDLFS